MGTAVTVPGWSYSLSTARNSLKVKAKTCVCSGTVVARMVPVSKRMQGGFMGGCGVENQFREFHADRNFLADQGLVHSNRQDLFAAVHEIGEMMQPTPGTTSIQGNRKIIGLERLPPASLPFRCRHRKRSARSREARAVFSDVHFTDLRCRQNAGNDSQEYQGPCR